jgi:chromosome segregation ATPase
MSAMSDQPVTLAVLAQFHREVILPDVERMVDALLDRRVQPRFDAIDQHLDALYHGLERLETEYQAIKAGLQRLEQQVDGVDRRVAALEAEHRDLVAAVHRLDERLSRVERRLDQLVAPAQRPALQSDVQQLRARLDAVEAQVEALRKRLEP